jgi:alpha-D-ribose 1-methylphosphonate 5-triphosphate synthase subunit PhnG
MSDRPPGNQRSDALASRQALMRVCFDATIEELEHALAQCGGDGAPFNVGEATVTRAVIRLANGTLGYSYLLGRSEQRARLAAIVDALGQEEAWRAKLETALVRPVAARREAELMRERQETAATRVNFFTLVRGED